MNITDALNRLVARQDLSFADSQNLFTQAMEGNLTDAQLAGLLMALRTKGETVGELAGATAAMRALSLKVEVSVPNLVDTCGTGGSGGAKLFNISTAAAIVAAAGGAHVAKHGNRAMTSKSGSADLLEAAGVDLTLEPQAVARCITDVGVGFMFAQAHHSAMRHAATARRELAIRTMMNVLGPLTNPAGAPNQVIGVFAPEWQQPMIEVLAQLGSNRALTVHSDGLDEFSLAAPAQVVELKDGEIRHYSVSPADVGLREQPIDGLTSESVTHSLEHVTTALTDVDSAAGQIVAYNAGAALYAAGVSDSLKDGVSRALDAISSGKAEAKLAALAATTQQLATQAAES